MATVGCLALALGACAASPYSVGREIVETGNVYRCTTSGHPLSVDFWVGEVEPLPEGFPESDGPLVHLLLFDSADEDGLVVGHALFSHRAIETCDLALVGRIEEVPQAHVMGLAEWQRKVEADGVGYLTAPVLVMYAMALRTVEDMGETVEGRFVTDMSPTSPVQEE